MQLFKLSVLLAALAGFTIAKPLDGTQVDEPGMIQSSLLETASDMNPADPAQVPSDNSDAKNKKYDKSYNRKYDRNYNRKYDREYNRQYNGGYNREYDSNYNYEYNNYYDSNYDPSTIIIVTTTVTTTTSASPAYATA